MPTVTHLEALEILDCRGVPTLEVSCVLDGGIRGNAAAPAAGSPGPYEVLELRDIEDARHRRLGCHRAVAAVEGEIRNALVGKRFGDQAAFDRALRLLDGTSDRSRLGGNTSFAVSLAFARAHAAGRGVPLFRHFGELIGNSPARLPAPMFALFSNTPGSGGERGPLALSVIPAEAGSIDAALATAAVLRRTAETLSREKFDGRVGTAPDGGLEAPFYDTTSMLTHAEAVVRACGDGPRPTVEWVLRASAHRRHEAGWYRIDREKLTSKEVMDRLVTWCGRWPLAAIIDPLAADQWEQWSALTARLPPFSLTAGDDLLATNLVRVEKAATEKAARAIVIKPAQTGSLTDAARTVRFARKAGMTLIVSGRSGETEDDWITDLAVGWGAEYLQAGAVFGSERLAKYNRLLAIEKKTRWPVYHRTAPVPP
jgi:enolase